jgi:hypothetical protein
VPYRSGEGVCGDVSSAFWGIIELISLIFEVD